MSFITNQPGFNSGLIPYEVQNLLETVNFEDSVSSPAKWHCYPSMGLYRGRL